MKKGKFMLIVGTAAWCATATFGSNPLPEDSMDAVRTMLRFAHANPRDTFTLDAVYVEPNFSMPEVFFGMVGIEGDWPVARRKAAFDAYLAVMADTDFSDETNNDRMLPIWATAQCMSMNYTNALPYIRRLVLNTTLTGWRRRREIGKFIAFAPVADETTATIEAIFTNRVDFTWEDRKECFDYASKVVAANHSNLVAQSVCDRAAHVFTQQATEWQLYGLYDSFWVRYYSGYAMSSNRLEFLTSALSVTNMPSHSRWQRISSHFTSVTNQLLSSGQPLQWIEVGDGGGN